VGAALCLQGIRKAKGDPVLSPSAMRDLLVDTGSPQVDGDYGPATQLIGPQPDLRRAYRRLYPPIFCPRPIDCYVAPIHCLTAPILKCPPAPIYACKPSPIVVECPPAPRVLECPPAPRICSAGPLEACAAGPTQGWEDPHDWDDPIFEYHYLEDIGHALVLARKSMREAGEPADEVTEAEEAAEAAKYGYDEVYWKYNTAGKEAASEASKEKTRVKSTRKFKPSARKRTK
jgi:hypothetical protein